jgi:hypothetical protein
MSETRKLAAILVADVVGYSRLARADEDRTLARLRGLRSDLIDPAIAAHHGRIVKRTGDGSIIEFRSVVDAVRCAIEVQNGIVERNAGVPPSLTAASQGTRAMGRRERDEASRVENRLYVDFLPDANCPRPEAMIKMAITEAAFEAICATMPLGSTGYEAERSETGTVFIWLDQRAMDRLKAERQRGEDYSGTIIRLATGDA